jgi:DNA-binding response OmpR family regulator
MGSELLSANGYALLVDDDVEVGNFVAQCLQVIGYPVVQARTGAEGIRLYEERREEITFVLSDIVMPGMFGDLMAERLLQINPGLKIIFMSGNVPNSLDTVIPLNPGENFLQKPFSIQELRECIHRNMNPAA